MKKFEPGAQTNAQGALKFLQAELHDVPTLEKVAVLTRQPKFAHLQLDELRGRYEWTGSRLESARAAGGSEQADLHRR